MNVEILIFVNVLSLTKSCHFCSHKLEVIFKAALLCVPRNLFRFKYNHHFFVKISKFCFLVKCVKYECFERVCFSRLHHKTFECFERDCLAIHSPKHVIYFSFVKNVKRRIKTCVRFAHTLQQTFCKQYQMQKSCYNKREIFIAGTLKITYFLLKFKLLLLFKFEIYF